MIRVMVRIKDQDQNKEKQGEEERQQILDKYKKGTLRGMKRLVEDAVGEAEIVVEMECE